MARLRSWIRTRIAGAKSARRYRLSARRLAGCAPRAMVAEPCVIMEAWTRVAVQRIGLNRHYPPCLISDKRPRSGGHTASREHQHSTKEKPTVPTSRRRVPQAMSRRQRSRRTAAAPVVDAPAVDIDHLEAPAAPHKMISRLRQFMQL